MVISDQTYAARIGLHVASFVIRIHTASKPVFLFVGLVWPNAHRKQRLIPTNTRQIYVWNERISFARTEMNSDWVNWLVFNLSVAWLAHDSNPSVDRVWPTIKRGCNIRISKINLWLALTSSYVMWGASVWLTYDRHHCDLHPIEGFDKKQTRVRDRVGTWYISDGTTKKCDGNDTSRMRKNWTSNFATFVGASVSPRSQWLTEQINWPRIAVAHEMVLVVVEGCRSDN